MIWKDFQTASISSKLAAIAGFLFIVVCILCATVPEIFLSAMESAGGLYTSVAIDVAFGLLLIWAAPSSRLPVGFRVLGIMALLEALFYLLMPIDFWADYISWWLIEQAVPTRILSVLVGIPIGALIIFAAIPSAGSLREQSTVDGFT